MAGKVVELSDANFAQEVLQASQPVLVDFWAPWCGPCRQITPMIEQLADENEGSAKVVKVNIDENQRTAQDLNVMSIPTLIVFKDGHEACRFVGAQHPKTRLQDALDEVK